MERAHRSRGQSPPPQLSASHQSLASHFFCPNSAIFRRVPRLNPFAPGGQRRNERSRLGASRTQKGATFVDLREYSAGRPRLAAQKALRSERPANCIPSQESCRNESGRSFAKIPCGEARLRFRSSELTAVRASLVKCWASRNREFWQRITLATPGGTHTDSVPDRNILTVLDCGLPNAGKWQSQTFQATCAIPAPAVTGGACGEM